MPATQAPTGAPPELTVLDLFSGAGGFSAGFHAAGGYRTVRAVEVDTTAAATFAANFGDDLVYNGPVAAWLEMHDVPEVDVIIGGPPCQGFSTLGNQDAEDKRNELWLEYAEAVVRAQPKYFVIENVGAFRRSAQYQQLEAETARGGLLGDYLIESDVLNAADYGAAQARRRTIAIGHHRDLPAPGLPNPTHAGNHIPLSRALHYVRREVERTELPEREFSFAGKMLPGIYTTRELHVTRNYTPISRARFRWIPAGGNRMDIPMDLRPTCWRDYSTGSLDVMGRLHLDRPSVTIRTEFWKPEKGRYLHPTENRAITHFEAARIQGFPDHYKWVGSKTAIGHQIGNAVPIPLGRAIALHLAALPG